MMPENRSESLLFCSQQMDKTAENKTA